MESELEALAQVAFRTAYSGNDIWRDDVIHVDGIHSSAFERVLDALARTRDGLSVGNVVIQGRPGIGKSHFLGRVRHAVIEQGQIFVLFQPSTARQFWDSLALAYRDALHREAGAGTQLRTVLHGLGDAIGLKRAEIEHLAAGTFDPTHLKDVRRSLQSHLGRRPGDQVALDVALALILTNSEDFGQRDLGDALLQGQEIEGNKARAHSIRASRIPCREVVNAFDRLMGAAGCTTLVAVDQLDGLIALGRSLDGAEQQSLTHEVAVGLMDLAEDVQHSLIVVSCLNDTWTLVRERALPTAHARYPTVVELREIPSAEIGEALVSAYLRVAFARAGYTPEYPTWPVRSTAFADAVLFSPRSLITVVQDHCVRCRENGRVIELEQLPNQRQGLEQLPNERRPGEDPPQPPPPPGPEVDRRFSQFVREADVADALDEKKVDGGLPALLRAGLTAWAEENAATGDFSVDPPLGRNPSLHARLRRIVDADTDDEVHWSFRAVLNDNAVAALHRLRAAVTASGLELSGERRRLFILRNAAWSQGRKTRQALDAFKAHGGTVVELLEADLKVFRALQQLLEEQPKGLAAWLVAHRPASGTTLLAPLIPEPAGTAGASASSGAAAPSPAAAPLPAVAPSQAAAPSPAATASKAATVPSEADEDSILLGLVEGTGRRVSVPLEDLRRHTVIFAGSGSGKTVLIRRLVEECALKGVSAVVLDPNNDLARLGLPWPAPPRGWLDDDADKAATYLRDTEVVVWTPRLTTGRPLSFAPLAGLGDVADDADEFEIALDNAVASLVPRSGLPGSGAKLSQGRAVLKEALGAYVRRGRGALQGFLGYLSALPAGVSRLASGEKIAADVAQTLLAETVNDPLLGGTGEAVDPSILLQPASGWRARISVISLVGLPNDEQRQQFVNQLQMALFAWVKKHPAGDRPLGGLFVMDEAQTFAPSAGRTATTASTLALASQARKYGLGLVFATQAPKGLHNQIPGNATTQFFGLLNAPAQIAAAREMAAQKGGDARGIARLRPGEFFAVSDAVAFQRVRSPMCLSHHPRSPMTQEEVLELARARTADPE
ncbi:MAG: DUF87 domain-containing protein [Acidobacteria bacterium]|nr:DUF87 domain-containing protein [Acidobacteriota bacterium]